MSFKWEDVTLIRNKGRFLGRFLEIKVNLLRREGLGFLVYVK